ncbi:MAG: response regulator [Anaerolineales bacterium]|nr:response regulator [Anaerolineales bacterium]
MNLSKSPGVLIADDDPLVSEMIRGTLEDLGYRVAGEATNGGEAVELTRRLQPDLVLMDIEMPMVNGIEAARQIYQLCPTPVVMLTAYETPALVQQASMAGVGAYLIKPPRARELERAITVTIARFNDMLALRRMNEELQTALAKVKTLRGLLPICASCKKIRDDGGYWHLLEVYIRDHSEADFTHGLCPDCLTKIYPEFYE